MKQIIFLLIGVYQVAISPFLKTVFGTKRFCRYTPTCSQYAKLAIEKHGILKGGKLALLRILSCQPFSKSQKSFI
ncbi:MAG TPA: membrane protein insertion efficiency factor YidD [Candidatus Saccharimonadales bacterium]|nr:membrane protein insertion efficiency factor YidD [Candidatus Saccharimonadales bacterium]